MDYFTAMEALRYPVADDDVRARYTMLGWPAKMQRTVDNTVLMCEWDMSRYKETQEREQVRVWRGVRVRGAHSFIRAVG